MADVIDYKIFGDDMQIVEVELDPGEGVRAEAGAMMYMDPAIDMQTSTGGGAFKGFILQRLTGDGMAFVHAGGALIEKRLMPGEVLKLDTGCIVGFSRGVDYDIEFVGGFKNALFGGEGLFMATLEGPGTAYLQSLPFSRLANRIVAAARFGASKGESRGIGGDLLGGLLGGDR